MKTTWVLNCTILLALFTSCDSTETFYNSPFPKKNKDLTVILGNEITIKRQTDTLFLKITSSKNSNLITYSTGDTLFYGSVAKYRGLYYFSEKIKENYYYIYAVKISDSLIYGFDSNWSQMYSVEDEIRKGNFNKLLTFMSSDTSMIILHPYKDEMKKLYSKIINNITPDTIICSNKTACKNLTESIPDPEELEIFQKVYPNPAHDIINVDLINTGEYTYLITDLNGKIMNRGKIPEKSMAIDITKLPAGMYILTVINSAENQKESVKIVKTR